MDAQKIRHAVASEAPEPLRDSLDDAVTAADYALARIGSENAGLLVAALSAGWMTPREYETLKPLAVAVAYISGEPFPTHRGAA